MKTAWLLLNFIGLGLIVWGALYAIEDNGGISIVMVGMCCMAISVQLRKRAFRRK